jgi:hypothetical protein
MNKIYVDADLGGGHIRRKDVENTIKSIPWGIGFGLGKWIYEFILFGVLTAGGCTGWMKTKDDPLVDRSFLTDEPCKAPCWQGLELDKSPENEIIETLKELPFIDTSKIYTFSSSWLGDDGAKSIVYDCLYPRLEHCGTLRVSGDMLKELSYKVGYKLTLETIVSKLGPPDYIDYGPIHIDIGGCDLALYWPEQKIIAVYINKKAEPLCTAIQANEKIPPETLVTDLIYSVTEAFGPLPGGCCTRIPWPGFAEP